MQHNKTHFLRLVQTVETLRSEEGCPWDRRQTAASLVKYLHSEVTELVEAIDKEDHENICEELGDLLYLIVMIAQINSQNGQFSVEEVIKGIVDKLVRRHPHVFAGAKVSDEDELREQWQRIKAMEKKKK